MTGIPEVAISNEEHQMRESIGKLNTCHLQK